MQIRFSAQPAVSTFGAPAKPSATVQTLTPTPPDQLSIRFGNQSKPDYSDQTSEIANQIADISKDDGPLATAKRERLYKQLLTPLYLDRPDAGYLSALENAALGRNKKVDLSEAQQELLLAHLEDDQPAIQTTLFLHAAQTGDKARLGTLLRKNPDLINAQNKYGDTALHWAADRGHIEAVKALVKAGAKLDLDIQNKSGFTALSAAASQGHIEVVKYLKEAGAKLDIQTKQGNTALIVAASQGHIEVVKYLVEKAGAKPDIQAQRQAIMNGHTEVKNYLREAEAKLDIKTKDAKPDTGAQTPEEKPPKKPWWKM